MYSTKTIHKNINPNYPQIYTSIGDPYKKLNDLPERWKKKQILVDHIPKNAQNGFFTKLEHRPDPYTELAEKYTETQPLEKRKLGFGSHDAYKSGEFTSTKATERYRDMVKRESKLLDFCRRNNDKEKAALEKFQSIERVGPKDRFGNDLKEPSFLYDIGRTQLTPYDPKNAHDCFYSLPKHAHVDPKWKGSDPIRRLGTHRPMSSTVGEFAWKYKYGKPEYGISQCVDKFYYRGHMECQGF